MLSRLAKPKLALMLGIALVLTGYFSYTLVKGSMFLGTTVAPHTTTLDDGLVSHWTFDGADISGATAYDRSGQGNDGTISNAKPTMGKIGQALIFDGTGDRVDAPSPAITDNMENISISAWIYPTVYDGSFVGKDGGNNDGWVFHMSSDGYLKFLVQFDGTDKFRRTYGGLIKLNTWQHVMVTSATGTSATNIHIYVNGVEATYEFESDGSAAKSNDSADGISIGANSGFDYITGSMDDVRIYNRALSPDEVFQLYKMGGGSTMSIDSGTDPLAEGLAGYWTFDEASGSTTRDSSVNQNHGTTTNMEVADWTSGKIGGALDFDGVNEWVNAGSEPSLDYIELRGGLTISAWINPRTIGENDQGSIVVKDWTFTLASNNRFAFSKYYDSTNLVSYSPNNSIDMNAWQLVTVTWDGLDQGSGVHLYKNGVEIVPGYFQDGATTREVTDGANLAIGGDSYTANTFDGKIDEVRIYDRVLSADEVATLYRTTLPTEVDATLVGHWTFDAPDISGTTAYDRSGAGNNGTIGTGVTPAPGKIGQGLRFDSGVGNVTVTETASLINIPRKTVCAWIQAEGTNTWAVIASKREYDATDPGWDFRLQDYDTDGNADLVSYTNFSVAQGNWIVADAMPIPNPGRVWRHVCMTHDVTAANAPVFYMDGTLRTSTTDTQSGSYSSDAGLNLAIGGGVGGLAEFGGIIDDVRLYKRILSASEIASLYSATAGSKMNVDTATSSLERGLVGYWPFNGADVTDKIYDRSGQGSNGYFVGGATTSAKGIGKIGQALSFDGINDVVVVPAASPINDLSAFTYAAWVFPASDGYSWSPIIFKGAGSSNLKELFVDLTGGSGDGTVMGEVFTSATHAWSVSDAGAIKHNAWSHLLMTYDNAGDRKVHLYVNGTEISSYTTQNTATGVITADNATDLGFGATPDTQFYTYVGMIDDVRIYNRALSADEIKHLYNSGR